MNNYILGLLWGNQCFFLFDSHSNDAKIQRMSATGTAVLLKVDSYNHWKIIFSILFKLPNDFLLPRTIFQTKMHWVWKKYN